MILLLNASFLRVDIQIPIDLGAFSIPLYQPLVGLFEVTTLKLVAVSMRC